jgi:hypothetical protein
MELMFTPDDTGNDRASGYATVPYSSNAEDETVVETTEEDLAAIFENAKADGATLDGADEPIDVAIDDPLAFRDYLILEDDEVVFDEGYNRNPEV